MTDIPIPKQVDPAPVAPSMGDATVKPIDVSPATPSSPPAPPTSEPQGGADALRESGDAYPVTRPTPLPDFSVPREIGAIARQVPNSPHINRPVGPSSDDHRAGVPSASAATQGGSATIRDMKAPAAGGKY